MDVASIRQVERRLHAFLAAFHDCFTRSDTRQHLTTYVQGQISSLERKTVEPIALHAGVAPRSLQNFLSLLSWDHFQMRDRVAQRVVRNHPHAHAVGIIDETSDDKKGDKTPGVQRQYCGFTGKTDNCVVTVHLAYATPEFHCLLDGDLFLPESWSDDRERCRDAGIPDEVVYRPKWQIALELYDRAVVNGVTVRWLTFDEGYGGKPNFLRELSKRTQSYVAEVPKSFTAWTEAPATTERPFRKNGRGRGRKTPRLKSGSPAASTVEDLQKFSSKLRDQPWVRYRVKDGEKGPMIWDAKRVMIHVKDDDGLPIGPLHLVVARNPLDGEVKYFVSNAPAKTKVTTLLVVAFSRWKVERCFEDGKGEVGLDHYEGRTWVGLIRHLVLSSVSYLFLAEVHQELRGKKSGPERVSSPRGSLCVGAVVVA
jgi:SRSO17 transposase